MTEETPQTACPEALLALRAAGQMPVGRERIAMLEAVAAHGSITSAARALGMSYKAVWDGLNAVNNLLPTPALEAHAGGRGGGGARLTESGRHLIAAFHRLEAKLAEITPLLAGEGGTPIDLLFWSVAMKTSARNALYGRVVSVAATEVAAEVTLSVAPGREIVAVITRRSAENLGLAAGREVVALIKASFVLIAREGEAAGLSVANRIPGTVAERRDDGVSCEIVLDIGAGKTLAATITHRSAEALALAPGVPVEALFDAAHVILAAG